MVAVISTLIFAGAAALALGVIALSVGPQWRRIVRVAMGQAEDRFTPLSTLVQAERRIAVRRWSASAPVPVEIRRMRAAA
ncbi:putative butyrate kinase (DUF1464 family) [Sphingomonas jinjuensis]|uniref:Putative butyrate kinase (DUF1464 family) n=1 Tax=Sphingomonas jinjuensis TaxID=535907 RepID=A0A840FE58_9SPHN|nr:hypothetical protein [Sphingomonas jinjuensis]MBB4154024.1 putative butyrate kinase (DUF1464 family) [Sphingomonas jinjuensis]